MEPEETETTEAGDDTGSGGTLARGSDTAPKWITPASLEGREDIPWWVAYARHGIGVWDPRQVCPKVAMQPLVCDGDVQAADQGRSWSYADGCVRMIQPGQVFLVYYNGSADMRHSQCVNCGRAFAPVKQVVFDLDPGLAIRPSERWLDRH